MPLSGDPQLLQYSLTLRVPAWTSAPTPAAFGELYMRLQAQLELDSLQTSGSPPECHMGRGHALQIKILPAQGVLQCVRDLKAADGVQKPQTVETVTSEFLVALSETMGALRPALLASPVAQLRALWPVGPESAPEALIRLGAGEIHAERLRPGLLVGYHLIQDPRELPSQIGAGVADVRIEPFVRDLSCLWVEATFSMPTVAIPGVGVRLGGQDGAPSDRGARSVYDCGTRARELLNKVPALF